MIKEEKISMMTQVAMIQKREERRSIEICGYRKKDYVSIQMIKIWICYTMAYLLLDEQCSTLLCVEKTICDRST